MDYAILDCYTDEPSGLGVPPYLGTYPRYLYGALSEHKPKYLTIDDLRAAMHYRKLPKKEEEVKTNTRIINVTRSIEETKKILNCTDVLLVSGGIQTPGKYLSGVPGTFFELNRFLEPFKCKKVLVGPAAGLGTRLEGGKGQEGIPSGTFDAVEKNFKGIEDYDKLDSYALAGADILEQIPYPVMIELESGRGCPMACSFCTEPLKYGIEDRNPEPIIEEAKALAARGAEHFRFGKATCFYAYGKEPERMDALLAGIKRLKPKTLHIDNANPNNVTEELTKTIVKHCTPGNTAAFGVESFDMEVVKANRLNCKPEKAIEAIRIINKIGAMRGENGMPMLLPGINIIFGLLNETKKTHEENMRYLKQILEEDLLLRRINIRQAVSFEGTYLHEHGGTKFVRKNKKRYWKWRNEIRQEVDLPMLRMLVPKGTIMKDVRMEIYDGNTTFGRQWGTYPLITGVKERLELGKSYDIRVTDHMLRSVTGEPI